MAPFASVSATASAQTAPITSSGLNTQISGPISVGGQVQYDITGGTRPNGGPNLFHSFGEFGVPNNTIANFHNNSNSGLVTSNILGRVTGGNESHIFGTIRTSEFGNANLFLMNPAGFLFGPNATLDVGGMVSFTSADYLKFEDGRRFNATPNTAADALLTASPVAAFGFLGSHPGAIRVRGSHLEVKPEKGIVLVGGNITIESGTTNNGQMQRARLSAPNGQIQLASTASPGEFPRELNAMTLFQPLQKVHSASFTSFGSVSLAPGSIVDVAGTNTIAIRGGQFVLSVNDAALTTAEKAGESNSISLNLGSSIISSNAGMEPGADIQIATTALRMDGGQVKNETSGAGKAGSIEMYAQNSISITDSIISSSSNSVAHGAGSGGSILLRAPFVEIGGTRLSSATLGPGNAGSISVHSNVLKLLPTSNSFVEFNATTSGSGHGGDISIWGITGPGSRASEVTLSGDSALRSETLKGNGTAGNITVEALRLALMGGSQITTASRENGSGNAGNVILNATESVLVSGSFVTSDISQGSTGTGGQITITTPKLTVNQDAAGFGGLISTSTTSSGNAGTVTINSDRVVLAEGGSLSSNSALDDPIFPPPSGAAGTIVVQGINGPGTQANSIMISGQDGLGVWSGISTDTQGTGAGGNITVHAESITLQDSGKLSAETSGIGASAVGGTIAVNANHVQLHSGATITANSNGMASAGNINATATDGLTMQHSSITTLVHPNGTGSNAGGGNIKITTSPTATVYLQDSTISASVPGSGDGGNVTIDPQFVVLQNSRILAQAEGGRGGNITIRASMFQRDAASVVNADSKSGVNGTVTIQSPYAPAGGKIQPLGNRPLQAASLLSQRCAAVAGGQFSSFTVAGRDSLPTEPGGWLSSPLALALPHSHGDTMISRDLRGSYEPTGELPLLSLRQIAPRGFLTQALAADQPAGCRS